MTEADRPAAQLPPAPGASDRGRTGHKAQRTNLVFRPLGILSGALAGTIAQRGFDRAWGLIDDQGPPAPNHRGVGLAKLAAALALQGALSQLVRGLADHGTRRGVSALTGEWPD